MLDSGGNMAEQDKDFVEYVVKALVDSPDKVEIKRTVDERGVLLELLVAPEDMGKIIGKQGKTAIAIRSLLRVVGAKNNALVNLKITEPEGSVRPPRQEYKSEAPVATEEVPAETPKETAKEDTKSALEDELGV